MITAPAISQWLVCPKPNPRASLRLFGAPYAGGRAMIFKSWTESLPDSVEIFGFEPPGRGIRLREAAFKRIGPLVESVTAALLPYLDKPFVLFGHSMGARIVFEIARNLRRENRPMPRHLFVSGSPAPQIKDEDPPTYNLPEAEFIDEVRKLNGTPKEVLEHQELLQL